ncbi:hypothetical protein CDL12_01072 [Handroanthus impetiginosus]|uniref:Uncharacterized protein n=1 Tax=Handroanthus impetiginosus TaxID=429701 RepID=A0A2G9I8W4_9LAMI|nr:hypothetical protein CDL12_01072 [Handroanthus impetiginosus]
MSELSTSKSAHFSSRLISDLILLFSFIVSHPLYFSYFIFFFPCLLKLVSFLSPLFIPTFLVLLAFLTELGGYSSVLEKLRSKKECQDDEFESFDDLGLYEILFGSSLMEIRESPAEFLEEKSEENHLQDLGSEQENDLSVGKVGKNPDSGPKVEKNTCPGVEEKRLENFLKILDEFEKMASNAVEKTKFGKIDKVVEKPTIGSRMRNGSEANGNKITPAAKVSSNNDGKEQISTVKAHSQRICSNVDHDEDDREGALKVESSRTLDNNYNLGTYGSMRKEKEWKRTLACKLFEERHNVDGGEGMDSLWEAYEMDSNKGKIQNGEKMKKNKKKVKVEEEDEEINGQLCCLQALKLSTGKMNLGMGRPNLVKISKAIKGIGWLHNVTKHSKKVHNNGDKY